MSCIEEIAGLNKMQLKFYPTCTNSDRKKKVHALKSAYA